MYSYFIKPTLDLLFALIIFLIVSPFFLLITLMLYINNNGSPFFYQKRPGKNERIFSIIKFKTMTDKKDDNGDLLPDSDRLTKLGLFIRKTSLDELPQLLNVLSGKMSIVGPRPLLVDYLPLYNQNQRKRHQVKPGITGWAQVNGRNAISWQEKFNLDVWYVDNMSFILDLKILLMTITKVIKSKDINAVDHVTSQKFNGN